MARGAKIGSAGARRAKQLLVRLAARPRRAIIWTELKRRAAPQGFAAQDLERFYHYLSIHLKLEGPEYTEPLQKPENFFPGLRAQPVYDAAEFSWVARLVDDYERIRQELLDFSTKLTLDAQGQGLADRGQWNVLYFYKGGRQIEATTRGCPHTSEILDSIPGAAGEAGQTLLSVLTGNSHINRHYAPTNVRLRCHLGIVVPEGARIRIGDEKYEWQEGKCLVFDDSFDHEVWNDSSDERVVLIVDFWHPDLTAAERWAIIQARRMRFGLRDILHA